MADSGQPAAGEDPPDPRLYALGQQALEARMRDDHPVAHQAIFRLLDQFGLDGIWIVMLAWTDTLIEHAYPGTNNGEPTEIAWEARDQDGRKHGERHQDTEAVSYGCRFGGRFILARHHDDQAMAEMLLDTAVKDGRGGEAICGLLDVVAYTLRAALAGECMEFVPGRLTP